MVPSARESIPDPFRTPFGCPHHAADRLRGSPYHLGPPELTA
jgi:hypothetical protein